MTRIDPFDLWNDFKSWVNTQQGGFMPPQGVFTRVANVSSLELWKKLTGVAEKSQEIKDMLLPFLVSKNVLTQPANSYYTIAQPPVNYGRFATAKILLTKDKKTIPDPSVDNGKCCKGNIVNIQIKTDAELAQDYYDNTVEAEIQMVDNQKWSAMLQHKTKSPTFEKPKMTQVNGSFKVAPREVSVVVFNYYTEPVDAVFAYTPTPGNPQTGSGGSINYDPNASTQFQWTKIAKTELLEMIKQVYIGYTRDGLFKQIDSAVKAKA